MLSTRPVNTREVECAADTCRKWMTDLALETACYLEERLPAPYLHMLGAAALSSDPQELTEIYESFQSQELAYRQWTLAYFLAKNSNTPEEVKDNLFNFYQRGYAGRIIRDVLADRSV